MKMGTGKLLKRYGQSFKSKSFKGLTFLPLLAFIFVCFFLNIDDSFAQNREHLVYFEGTCHELHVYKIFGKKQGKTLMLIGGIQGDEPGGFLSADLYADFVLEKGNLIVVPRANFYSILLNKREVNEDLNRKFAGKVTSNYEDKLVVILKDLIAESDLLLNLHDGSGFYADKWISPQRNPKKYGQSIIADIEIFVDSKTGKTIYLGDIARSIIKKMNKDIKRKQHLFHFNNHKTKENQSVHKEQRKSATYYALYTCGIPAFGIETSKSLSLELKVLHHNLAINAFMNMLEIVPSSPGIYLEPPKLFYIVVSVNDSMPMLVFDRQTISVKKEDTIFISHVEANYERGISVDIVSAGGVNDFRKKVNITKDTRVVIKKDYYPCGKVYITTADVKKDIYNGVLISNSPHPGAKHIFFKIDVNGCEKIVTNNSILQIIKGDTFLIKNVFSGLYDSSDLEVNFKGFVGDFEYNTGEDRGYIINTGTDLIKRFSLNNRGEKFQILVSYKKKKIAKLIIEIKDPVLKYLVMQNGEDLRKICYKAGDFAEVDIDRNIVVCDIKTNIKDNAGIQLFLIGQKSFKQPVYLNKQINILNLISNRYPGLKPTKWSIEVRRGDIVIGAVFLK